MATQRKEMQEIIQYNRIKNMWRMGLPTESDALPREVTDKRIEREVARRFRQYEKEWDL